MFRQPANAQCNFPTTAILVDALPSRAHKPEITSATLCHNANACHGITQTTTENVPKDIVFFSQNIATNILAVSVSTSNEALTYSNLCVSVCNFVCQRVVRPERKVSALESCCVHV